MVPPRPEAATTAANSPSPGLENAHQPPLVDLAATDVSVRASDLGSALATSHESMHSHDAWPQEGVDMGMGPTTSYDLDIEHLMNDLQAIRSAVARAEQGAVPTDVHVRQSASALITAVDDQLSKLAAPTGNWQGGRNQNERGNT